MDSMRSLGSKLFSRAPASGTGAWILLSFCLALSSCTFLRELAGFVVTEPSVEVREIQVKKLSLQGLELGVRVHLENPNQFTVSLEDLELQLSVGEAPLAKAQWKEKLEIEKLSGRDIVIPTVIDVASASTILKDWIGRSSPIVFLVRGEVTIGSSLGHWRIKISKDYPLGAGNR